MGVSAYSSWLDGSAAARLFSSAAAVRLLGQCLPQAFLSGREIRPNLHCHAEIFNRLIERTLRGKDPSQIMIRFGEIRP